MRFLFFLLLIKITVIMSESEPIMTIPQGKLRGKTGLDLNGSQFYKFQGIPFAKPPIAELRFKAPQSPEPWDGVLEATEEKSECYSKFMFDFETIIGSEDCLYLNVYTPQLPEYASFNKKLKPVMVFIHGGGFIVGSSKTSLYGPEFLVSEDVVLVTIQYRLGVLGFLSAKEQSTEVPGNNGLKDIVMALQWVNRNIIHFMGDPGNVTIFGESAGSAACHYLMLSPMSKGLFHKVIMQSGTALNIWAQGRKLIKELAENAGFKTENEAEALEFLRKLPVEKLFEAQESIKDLLLTNEMRPHGPVIEVPSKLESNFLSEAPVTILKSGNYNKVPIMIGYTSAEGFFYNYPKKRSYDIENLEEFIPYTFNIKKGSNESSEAAKKIKEFFFKNGDDPKQFYKLSTDVFFLYDIYNTIKFHSYTSKTPIYFYRFSAETKLNQFKKVTQIKSPGVSHGDDLFYFFKSSFTPELVTNSLEEKTVRRCLSLWANFARSGNPNPKHLDALIDVKWPKVEVQKHHFLDIGEELSVGVNPEARRMHFWDEIASIGLKNDE